MLRQPIKLKKLALQVQQKKNISHDEISKHIPLEVQHVEMQEEQQVQVEQFEQVNVDVEAEQIQTYEGELINFEKFDSNYKKRVREQVLNNEYAEQLFVILK